MKKLGFGIGLLAYSLYLGYEKTAILFSSCVIPYNVNFQAYNLIGILWGFLGVTLVFIDREFLSSMDYLVSNEG